MSTALLKPYIADAFAYILSLTSESGKLLNKKELVEWLSSVPQYSTFRVNTLVTTPEKILPVIKTYAEEKSLIRNVTPPDVYIHPVVPDCIVIGGLDVSQLDLEEKNNEVIVDQPCGVAVLRGADIYSCGIMGMLPDTRKGDLVSVYADISKKCLRGLKTKYLGDKLFVGNGIVEMNRSDIFKADAETHVAVHVTNPVSGLMLLPLPPRSGIYQNLPSTLCCHMLDVQPGYTVLDMCAAPGNKTTHIAALMENRGLIVALDKTKKKVGKLKANCDLLAVECVKAYMYNSTKLFEEDGSEPEMGAPPYKAETFDCILLDAPCSCLGQRPHLITTSQTAKFLKSLEVVQRNLLSTAVKLLKPDGTLVYSTCSVLCEENENIVSWALRSFPCLKLVPAEPVLGSPGLPQCGLTEQERTCVQRFGPACREDSIGFFIAKFQKTDSDHIITSGISNITF